MDSFEGLLNKILSKYPEKTKEEVIHLVEKRKEDSHGLLSDIGAMSLVAQQMLVQPDGSSGLEDQKISTAHAGLNDVTVSGEIIDLSELREFPRQDGTTGKLVRLRLQDLSGQIGVALWDLHADQLIQRNAKVGARLRLEHGYTKHGRGGEVELHLGGKGRVQLFESSSSNTRNEELPWTTIREIAASPGPMARRLRLLMRRVQGQRTVNGPATALCEDETGLVMVKFWDDKIEEAARIGEGKGVIIENPTVAERNGTVYVNVGRNSTLKQDAESSSNDFRIASIVELKPDPVLHVISGKIVERSEVREVETREGRRVKVSNIRVEDETGRMRVSLWDHHADRAESLRLGDMVKLIGVKVRDGFNREVEASSVFLTEIEKSG
jgi:replication factor A1